MFKVFVALSLSLLSAGCVVALGNTGTVADAINTYEDSLELQQVVADLKASYETGEVREAFIDSIAESDEVIVIGSLAEEWTVGIETLREAMSSGGGEVRYVGRDLKSSELQLARRGNVGWLVELADLHYDVDGERVSLQGFRATSIWERGEDGWKIVHFHGSMPDAVNEI